MAGEAVQIHRRSVSWWMSWSAADLDPSAYVVHGHIGLVAVRPRTGSHGALRIGGTNPRRRDGSYRKGKYGTEGGDRQRGHDYCPAR